MDVQPLAFRKLRVYIEAKAFAVLSYRLQKEFPAEERYALCDQIRRASSSVPSNIAEGAGRLSSKDQARFIEIAFGSLNETFSQFDLAHDLGYITDDKLLEIEQQYLVVSSLLSGLRRSIMSKLQP